MCDLNQVTQNTQYNTWYDRKLVTFSEDVIINTTLFRFTLRQGVCGNNVLLFVNLIPQTNRNALVLFGYMSEKCCVGVFGHDIRFQITSMAKCGEFQKISNSTRPIYLLFFVLL